MKERLHEIIQKIWTDLCIKNGLDKKDSLNSFIVEEPPKNIDADYATNVCFLGSKTLKKSPIKIAEEFIELIKSNPMAKNFIDDIFIAGPGFLNFVINKKFLVRQFFKEHNDCNPTSCFKSKNKKILVEFVSANPTGPLHIGHARGAAIGDSLARLLTRVGYTVDKEYYVNDAGNQIDVLAKSLETRYRQVSGETIEMPENCYKGEYITDIAKELLAEVGKNKKIDEIDFKKIILDKMLGIIGNDLEKFNIDFKNWFFETSLFEKNKNGNSALDEAIEILKTKKHAQIIDGALWLMTNDLGDDDKNRVIIRSDGRPTYFATDIAYHKNKFDRGYDSLIDIWGADHHGYVARIKAAVEYLGYENKRLETILYQLVSLLRDGEKIAMSTRSGEFVSLEEVLTEVGTDATRFFLLMRDGNSPLEFDLELAKKKSSDNPVYYVQYAHARIHSILNNAKENGILLDEKLDIKLENFLNTKEDIVMIKSIQNYSEILELCVKDLSSHHITAYLLDLAGKFHNYYSKHKIADKENMELSKSRLFLCKLVSNVIKDGLDILGVSAPISM